MFKYNKELADKLVKAIAGVEIKASGEDTYRMVISLEKDDRDGEIILLEGIDFKNYKKNPVVLVDHSYCVEDIVGKTTKIGVEGNQLIAEWTFADTEDAQLAKQLYDGGFLKASSIGFIPLERDANDRSIITKCELLEWSLVAVPCNPYALSLDGKQMELFKKGVERGVVKEITEDKPEEPTIEEKTATPDDMIKKVDAMMKQMSELMGKMDAVMSGKDSSDIAEIKELLKALTDKNVKEQETDELQEKKKVLQNIDNAVGEALKNMKILAKK